ncbi:MAG: hypothetical protein WDN27_01245 [Candidatus Saccharibacteria bacterium]
MDDWTGVLVGTIRPPWTVLTAQANSGTGTSATASVTLPTWTPTGDEDLILLVVGTANTIGIGPPTGYSPYQYSIAGGLTTYMLWNMPTAAEPTAAPQ